MFISNSNLFVPPESKNPATIMKNGFTLTTLSNCNVHQIKSEISNYTSIFLSKKKQVSDNTELTSFFKHIFEKYIIFSYH